MIKLKDIINENILDVINSKYPIAGPIVDGREVLKNIDNWSSIDASLYHYKILNHVRELPMSDFTIIPNLTSRIKRLAEQIQETGKISPLIVVIDKEGPYILEGSHRIDALKLLNAKSFPALVIVDLD